MIRHSSASRALPTDRATSERSKPGGRRRGRELGDVGEHAVRRGSHAVEHPVGEALRHQPHRQEDDRRACGGEHRRRNGAQLERPTHRLDTDGHAAGDDGGEHGGEPPTDHPLRSPQAGHQHRQQHHGRDRQRPSPCRPEQGCERPGACVRAREGEARRAEQPQRERGDPQHELVVSAAISTASSSRAWTRSPNVEPRRTIRSSTAMPRAGTTKPRYSTQLTATAAPARSTPTTTSSPPIAASCARPRGVADRSCNHAAGRGPGRAPTPR